jgi:CRP-like cAMP-binding protein
MAVGPVTHRGSEKGMTALTRWDDERRIAAWPANHLLKPAITLEQDAIIVKAGDEVRRPCLIERGVVGRFVETGERAFLRGVRGTGWFAGAASAVAGVRADATIRTLTECVVRPLPIHRLWRALQNPAVSRWLARMLAVDLTSQTAYQRAAEIGVGALLEETLIEMFAEAGRVLPDGSLRLTMPMLVTGVARLLGTARPTMSRLLAELGDRGAVRHTHDRFQMPAASPLLPRSLARRFAFSWSVISDDMSPEMTPRAASAGP